MGEEGEEESEGEEEEEEGDGVEEEGVHGCLCLLFFF